MTRYALTIKGSSPPQYYVNISASGQSLYSTNLADADMFDSAEQAAIYCEPSEQITPVDTFTLE